MPAKAGIHRAAEPWIPNCAALAAFKAADGREESGAGMTPQEGRQMWPEAAPLPLQRLPHLDVALGGPDARMGDAARLVVGAADAERHAVLEDDPASVFGRHRLVGLVEDLLQGLLRLDPFLCLRQQLFDEIARTPDRLLRRGRRHHRIAA